MASQPVRAGACYSEMKALGSGTQTAVLGTLRGERRPAPPAYSVARTGSSTATADAAAGSGAAVVGSAAATVTTAAPAVAAAPA